MSQVSAAYGSDSGFSGKANVNEHSIREKRKRAPAATDDGVAIGAALAAPVAAGFGCGEMTKAYLGSQSAPEEIEAVLRTYKLSYKQLDDPAETAADLVTGGKLIGWYQGREELGPRALGNRSMLADPRCS